MLHCNFLSAWLCPNYNKPEEDMMLRTEQVPNKFCWIKDRMNKQITFYFSVLFGKLLIAMSKIFLHTELKKYSDKNWES